MTDDTRQQKSAPPRHPDSSAGPPPELAGEAPALAQVLAQLEAIRAEGLGLEEEFEHQLRDEHDVFRTSARNLLHYIALRRHDIRPLQERLTTLGLSSLGRTESHVLAGIDAVLTILRRLANRPPPTQGARPSAIDFTEGQALLRAHTEALLGPRPAQRRVHIMVTMPSEAAHDYELVKRLVEQGMNCMRINCAHDDRDAWAAMVAHVRRATREVGHECRVLMDLAGPKLRTGPIDTDTQVVKWRPQRDLYGRVTTPAHIWLTPLETPEEPPVPVDGTLHLARAMLGGARTGDAFRFTDLRGKSRILELESPLGQSRWATATQTAYLRAGTVLQLTHIPKMTRREKASGSAEVGAPSQNKQFILLKPGDTLLLTNTGLPGRPAVYDAAGRLVTPAALPCTLPAIFGDVQPEERIWFDDGKIGGVIESVDADAIRIRITAAKPGGDKLGADKGINLPDSHLRLPGLTEKDLADLAFIAEHADLVGLSFVHRPEDVRVLQEQLARLQADHLGVILKIETRSGFEQLPHLLLAAMRSQRVGVMIARGDLAVECGYERLAEVQEEILWVCEAAHVPVIWATQVLETLAKKGLPSRAEITDAAMGERAECVMLNKGPHLVEALRVLDDILHRMEAHQSKKSARLRSLRVSALS